MSAVIVFLMKWKYAMAESRKWRIEHVQPWLCCSWDGHIRTDWELKVAGNMSAMIALLMKLTYYVLAESWKWRETYQPWLYCLWNGNTHWLRVESGGKHVSNDFTAYETEITHWLRVESGGNMSAVIVLLVEWKYAPPESQEHISLDGAAKKRKYARAESRK